MVNTVYDRLLRRELGDATRYSKVAGIYGDRKWINDMDIVNELGGHTGCVNALSWSRSGRLLASGSDDHHINIYSYLPESSSSQFELTTSILTGHSTNIFSVKFMPYSSDRMIVSATDDVRIFDIEHSGHSLSATTSSRAGRPAVGLRGPPDGVRVLTEGDTNAKVFRSHSDTVKRIVTEDSPFYFLTCSEDGDVRQWDIRQPSLAYPPSSRRWASSGASDTAPPPLISYKRYNLDLNTVSCSPSQPHYIALGGAHLHCFLHDRRMLGRDKLAEKGSGLPSPSNWSDHDDELMGQATRCVRKFAPNGQKRMKRTDNGHITACKISDANPNELIVSWSGDWIYSFDLLRSPDASEEIVRTNVTKGDVRHRVRDKDHKRKRTKSNSTTLLEGAGRGGSRQRTDSSHDVGSGSHEELSLVVQYENGQSEEIRIERPDTTQVPYRGVAVAPDSHHFRIARTTVKIRKNMFDMDPQSVTTSDTDPTGHASDFTSVLGLAATILPEMDDIASTWRYPVNPDEVDVALQNQLREWRAASRRFVQAAGTLARVLGGKLQTGGSEGALMSRYFSRIVPAPNERQLTQHEQFGYDFLKAILLWLDSGVGALVEGFSSRSAARFPIPPDASVDEIDDVLIPYLLHLAGDHPVVDVDVSRFEHDDTRMLFSSEKAAVLSFARALRIPFGDLSSGSSGVEGDAQQDRKAALVYWAFRVGRGVLWNASRTIRFSLVDRAFGGSGRPDARVREEESALRERQEDIDPAEEEDAVLEAELVSRAWAEESNEPVSTIASSAEERDDGPISAPAEPDEDNDEDEDSDGDVDSEDLEEDEDDNGDEDSDFELGYGRSGRVLWRSEFDRSRQRERVEADVPCSSHTRRYTGHCNVRTVKDVNFFGLQDEYVVSGSDSGHVFIWDRQTSQLLNILEADGDTVNVVQGHPYEPTMAVSGIDHTIKIFSPDPHAQLNARKGIGIHPSTFSRLEPFSRSRRRRYESTSESAVPRSSELDTDDEEEEKDIGPNGLSSRKRMNLEYQITSQNDQDRKGGNRDAFITRVLLAQLAQRARENEQVDGSENADGGGPIVISDDTCMVM
ncbi:WD40 repeat-like protein [Delitschia confertaspora ATCC 74209]|uniref:WD40 repeat-like protein n=1 Tax=Delitschia confertaspora ATCC 74209 TaxID=1513339 RepID=A0A9P4MUB4_9PLEO|nr:WD40 repeat-like protein [Delitschia confertaspora ATCC 74209]